MSVLIGVAELSEMLGRRPAPVLLDVRWALGDPNGRSHYLDAHISGAVYVDLETELAAPPSPAEGRHPLPALGDLQNAARDWGVRRESTVVAYDDVGGTSAARAWWLLRWAGIADVRLLDGGFGGWQAAGYMVESGNVTPERGDVILRAGAMPTVTATGAADIARDGVLLDARAGARFRGEEEPVDPVAGHIPGAASAPTTENLAPAGTFLERQALQERFATLGVTGAGEVAVYCGSGVTAAHQIAALAEIGVDAALYPGSWSQWCNDPDRPVATVAQ
jgi:thiosulfate/3-mercaptopyruvate sulfurtransferase